MKMSFDQMKLCMATDAILTYPDHNKRFYIYTDTSSYQLGASIEQEGRIIAYDSHKLSQSQLNYTTMEQELLFIFDTKEILIHVTWSQHTHPYGPSQFDL